TGKELANIPVDNEAMVPFLVLSPDGHCAAVADGHPSLRVWNMVTGMPRCTLQGFDANLPGQGESLAFSSDSSTLATYNMNGRVDLWDAGTGRRRVTFECYAGGDLRLLKFSPDGKTLATSGGEDNGAVKLWDIGMELSRAGVKDRSGTPTLSRNGRY